MICLIPDRCWAGFALANRHDCCCHNRFTPSSTVWKRACGGVCYWQGELLCISLTLFLAGLCRSCSDKLKTSANWRSCWSTQGWIAAVTQLVNYGTLPVVTQQCSLDLYIRLSGKCFHFRNKTMFAGCIKRRQPWKTSKEQGFFFLPFLI